MVAGMEHDQPHAFPHALHHALDDLVLHFAMRGMAPPHQYIGVGELVDGQAVLAVLQRNGGRDEVLVLADQRGDLAVHTLGVVLGHGLVLLLVDILTPDGDADRHGGSP